MKRFVFTVGFIMLLAGCVTRESGLAPRVIPFTPGRTTFREVVSAWGNPDSIKRDEAVWKTTAANGGQIKASYMLVGVTVSSSHLASREYRLAFDGKGVLTAARICDSLPGGATWTILPW